MAEKDYIGVLTVLRGQIESGFLNIAPRGEVDEPYKAQWKKMFVESLNVGIDAIQRIRHQMHGCS